MKKILLLLLLGGILSPCVGQSWRTPFTKTAKNAEGYREHQYFNPHLSKSSVAISYGYLPLCSYDWWSANAMKSRPNGKRIYDNIGATNTGTFSIMYSNQLTPWLELSVPITYSHSTGTLYETMYDQTRVAGTYKDDFFLVIPQVKISWLYNSFFHLYSRAGVGVGLGNRYQTIIGAEAVNSKAVFAWQVFPIGLEIGKRCTFFAEAGYGHIGVVNAGLKVRFNRSKDQSGRTRNEAIAEKHAWYKDILR